jgi:acyl-CoA thioesterase
MMAEANPAMAERAACRPETCVNDVVRARADAMWADDHASIGLGMQLDKVAPGRARLSMTVAERMANGHGICHGGFIFALADSAMAFAANPRGEPAVAQHASISFIRPAKVGERLIADATERMHAARSGIYDVRVSTAGGELVAEFRGHTRTIRGKAEG